MELAEDSYAMSLCQSIEPELGRPPGAFGILKSIFFEAIEPVTTGSRRDSTVETIFLHAFFVEMDFLGALRQFFLKQFARYSVLIHQRILESM